jgi:integrase
MTAPSRPTFATYLPPAPPDEPASRQDFAGLTPKQAVNALLTHYEGQALSPYTIRQKRVVLTRLLADLATRGIDLACVTTADLALYRAYLRDLVERGAISCNYAAHRVIQWNATMRAVFGETSRPGEGLIMRGFRQTPRIIEHLTQEDFAALLDAVNVKRWQNRHYRELMRAYLEVSWCAAARIGSLVHVQLRVCDLDLQRGIARLHRVKNRPQHDVVLSSRATDRLATWISFLQRTRHWVGPDTPLFTGPRGKVIAHQVINRNLHELAALAGLNKNVTSHVFRKSAGTIMALVNPKLAQEQLGITENVFNRHYNQPLLEDRLAHREILPGVAAARPSPEEAVGNAYLRYQRGEIGKVQLDQTVLIARLAAVDPRRKIPDAAYA